MQSGGSRTLTDASRVMKYRSMAVCVSKVARIGSEATHLGGGATHFGREATHSVAGAARCDGEMSQSGPDGSPKFSTRVSFGGSGELAGTGGALLELKASQIGLDARVPE